MDIKAFQSSLEQLALERGISKEKIIETLETALAAAYKKDYGEKGQIIRAKFNPDTKAAAFFQVKMVVDESMLKTPEELQKEQELQIAKEQLIPESFSKEREISLIEADEEAQLKEEKIKKIKFNPERHIMLDEARKINKNIQAGEEITFPLENRETFGRIAAQTAKQVIIQRIREAERESIFEEFQKKQGEVISAIVQRIEGRNVFLDLGRTIGLLPKEEQVKGERYRIGERIKTLLFLVEQNPKGPGLYLSRSHPRLISKLFEIEVPEIANGTVVIKTVAREAGSRSKIAVFSNDSGIDPVGSLVGQKGVRVNTVISELGGEKIDIIEWKEGAAEFIKNAISPAKILDVEIKPRLKEARITVAEDQMSLAIGRGGQNVRLAAKLTGWKLDICSRSGKSIAKATEEGEVVGEGIEPKI